ncbi:hypothetical protein IFM89_014116 [Coptis chinensis]|uniref:Cupin type-1 domain-containing protein n=1 Tax=Coptis chinensis TaxID=261450 RepID=A0A835LRS7_9MAGN|nr:hypothetical protein IFM89_014116 [Coptis chinensis]
MIAPRSSKLFVFLLLFFFSVTLAFGYSEGSGGYEEEEEGRYGGGGEEQVFLLPKSRQVMRSEAGEFRVVSGFNVGKKRSGIDSQPPMHIGFINMEPKSLFVPQYLDSSLIIFVRRGKAKIGWIYKDGLVEKNLKIGDVYRIPAGSTFYIVNTGEGQILQMICSIDTSESLGTGAFQSFFIGGGLSPMSILAGFDERTLTTAFNVSSSQLESIFTRQQEGPFVFVNGTHDSSKWASFMQLKHQERPYDIAEHDEVDKTDEQDSWTWRKLMNFVVGEKAPKRSVKSTDAYNLYDRKPDFVNKYGSSLALTDKDYAPLAHSDIGVYHVNLTAGAMMAPHVNPRATEYGVVLMGSGSVQVVYPNGTSAMNTVVNEGDVFWVPRYFPFSQIASRHGPFEFFGFTTSAGNNHPQFLIGASSILRTMNGPELATAFGVSQDRFTKLINAQNESAILPSAPAAPPRQGRRHKHEQEQEQEHEQEHEHHKQTDPEGELIELW